MHLILLVAMVAAVVTLVAALMVGDKQLRALPLWTRIIVLIAFAIGGGAAVALTVTVIPNAPAWSWFFMVGGQMLWMSLVLAVLVIASHRSAERKRVEVGNDDAPVVQLVYSILTDAIKKNASTILIDCDDTETWVTYRIEGAPEVVMRPDRKLHAHIINRVMAMAGLGYSDYGLVSEGHIHLVVGKETEQFFNVYLRKGTSDQPAALIELTDKQGLPFG